MRHFLRTVIATLGLATATLAFAQSTTGTITGVVRDQQGLVVPGASVELINEETGVNRSTVSLGNGAFTFAAVPQGRYTVRVTLSGFRVTENTGLQLRSNETLSTGALTLGVGQFTQVTTVTADTAVVQTASSEMSSAIEASQMDSLVARGRDPMSLFRVMPGVSQVSGGLDGPVSLGGVNGIGLPTVSGLQANLGNITLDGMPANDADTNNMMSVISMDAIEEIKLIGSGFQAEHGRSAGASMTVVSKSGTNAFRGTYAYYLRHDAFNENSFFNIRNNLPKPYYRYHTGSGTFGGPIGRANASDNKLFFFYAREDWTTDEPRTPSRVTVPTALERAGNFSQTVDTSGRLLFIRDPLKAGACNITTGGPACFDGNIIPVDRINRYGQAMLGLFPMPNFGDISVSNRNYNHQFQDVAHQTKALNHFKLDYKATDRDLFTVSLRKWSPITEGNAGLFGLESNWDQLRHTYAKSEWDWHAKHVRTFGLRLVNEASVGMRQTAEIYSNPDFDAVSKGAYGLGGLPELYPGANFSGITPQLTFGGVPSAANVAFDARFPIHAGDQRIVLSDTLSFSTASHLVKAGFLYEWDYNSEGLNGPCYSGCFNFGRDVNNPGDTNYAYANALLGNFQSYSQSNTRTFRGARNGVLEGFVQDSWKAHPNLTLELGLRMSSASSWKLDVLRYGHAPDVAASKAMGEVGANFDPARWDRSRQPILYLPACVGGAVSCSAANRRARNPLTGELLPAAAIGALVSATGDPFNGLVTQDDPMAQKGFRNSPGLQLGPRLGFSWDVTGDGTMAIRGGYGVTKQTITPSGSVANNIASNPPARVQPTVFHNNIATFTEGTGLLSPFAVNGLAVDWEPTTVHNFSLNVQRNLPFSTVVSAAYVGNRARQIPQTRNINVIAPGARFLPANIDRTNNVPLPDNFLRPMIGYGNVNVAEHVGESQYDSLQLTFNRRFTRGLQYGAAYTLSRSLDMAGTLPLYRDDKEYLWDYSGADRRHALSANFVWNVPGASRYWNTAVVRAVLDHWQIAGVWTAYSGAPAGVSFATSDGADILGGGDPGRIVLTCDPNLSRSERTFDRWFNTSCFSRPAKGDPGNASRQSMRLPGSHLLDANLSKMLVGREGRGLQFRAEFYNAFNQVAWTNVNTAARFDPQGNQINAAFGQVSATAGPRIIQLSLRATF